MNLDQRLTDSSEFIADLTLCQLRLSKNAAFPWVLLIPKRDNIVELIDLTATEQHQLMQEINLISQIMQDVFRPDKLNVATLGNVVPQLHVHIIARYTSDPSWPQPVWNTVSKDYSIEELARTVKAIRERVISLVL